MMEDYSVEFAALFNENIVNSATEISSPILRTPKNDIDLLPDALSELTISETELSIANKQKLLDVEAPEDICKQIIEKDSSSDCSSVAFSIKNDEVKHETFRKLLENSPSESSSLDKSDIDKSEQPTSNTAEITTPTPNSIDREQPPSNAGEITDVTDAAKLETLRKLLYLNCPTEHSSQETSDIDEVNSSISSSPVTSDVDDYTPITQKISKKTASYTVDSEQPTSNTDEIITHTPYPVDRQQPPNNTGEIITPTNYSVVSVPPPSDTDGTNAAKLETLRKLLFLNCPSDHSSQETSDIDEVNSSISSSPVTSDVDDYTPITQKRSEKMSSHAVEGEQPTDNTPKIITPTCFLVDSEQPSNNTGEIITPTNYSVVSVPPPSDTDGTNAAKLETLRKLLFLNCPSEHLPQETSHIDKVNSSISSSPVTSDVDDYTPITQKRSKKTSSHAVEGEQPTNNTPKIITPTCFLVDSEEPSNNTGEIITPKNYPVASIPPPSCTERTNATKLETLRKLLNLNCPSEPSSQETSDINEVNSSVSSSPVTSDVDDYKPITQKRSRKTSSHAVEGEQPTNNTAEIITPTCFLVDSEQPPNNTGEIITPKNYPVVSIPPPSCTDGTDGAKLETLRKLLNLNSPSEPSSQETSDINEVNSNVSSSPVTSDVDDYKPVTQKRRRKSSVQTKIPPRSNDGNNQSPRNTEGSNLFPRYNEGGNRSPCYSPQRQRTFHRDLDDPDYLCYTSTPNLPFLYRNHLNVAFREARARAIRRRIRPRRPSFSPIYP